MTRARFIAEKAQSVIPERAVQETAADGKKVPTNLHILMNWQKQGDDWKLLSRSATKL